MSAWFDVVVAADEAGGIGRDGDLAWRLKGDMAYFKRLTSEAPEGQRNAVIMGRKTWDSIPERFRPLRRRHNIVITRNAALPVPDGVGLAGSLDDALAQATALEAATTFVIGGATIYAQALERADCRRVYLTRVQGAFGCDAFLPPLPADFELESASEMKEDGQIRYDFAVFERRR